MRRSPELRRRISFFLVVWAALTPAAHAGRAIASAIPQALYDKASREGSVRVIVQLRANALPEGRLQGPEAIASQRQGIAAKRAAMMVELAGKRPRMIRAFETIPFVALEVAPNALSALAASPNVVAVEEDRIERALLNQSVPLIGADKAWTAGFDGTGVMVAILDTGVDKTHPFLSGKVVEEACFSANNNCPNGLASQIGPGAGIPCTYAPDGCAHGTFVAGIAAGAGASFSGVAKGAHILAVQVFSKIIGSFCKDQGEDPCVGTFVSDQIAGLEWVLALKTQYTIAAVNISAGALKFTSFCDGQEAARKAEIDNLRSVGIATVVASGNDGFTDALDAPACISTTVSVGSTTKTDTVSSFSNSASFLSLLAPGQNITSSFPGGGFAVGSGTSFATPHVTGAWAILKQKKPTASVGDVLTALVSTGLPITDPRNGIVKPRIRVDLALQALIPAVNRADVPQILNGKTLQGASGSQQRTFLTTDPIALEATYYDNQAACEGIAPSFVQVFVFNLEGVVVQQSSGGSSPSSLGLKYRDLSIGFDATLLGPGKYEATFLVRDCTNTRSVVLPEFLTFRIVAP